MEIIAMMDGCIDAKDYAGASACLLAHPVSKALNKNSIKRLWGFAYQEVQPAPFDEAMIEALADLARLIETGGKRSAATN